MELALLAAKYLAAWAALSTIALALLIVFK
jgi:hypothetical protein